MLHAHLFLFSPQAQASATQPVSLVPAQPLPPVSPHVTGIILRGTFLLWLRADTLPVPHALTWCGSFCGRRSAG